MKINVILEQEDFDSLHDVILEALNYPSEDLSNEVILSYWEKLPQDVKDTAIHWGTNDTVARDDIYKWLQENEKEK